MGGTSGELDRLFHRHSFEAQRNQAELLVPNSPASLYHPTARLVIWPYQHQHVPRRCQQYAVACHQHCWYDRRRKAGTDKAGSQVHAVLTARRPGFHRLCCKTVWRLQRYRYRSQATFDALLQLRQRLDRLRQNGERHQLVMPTMQGGCQGGKHVVGGYNRYTPQPVLDAPLIKLIFGRFPRRRFVSCSSGFFAFTLQEDQ